MKRFILLILLVLPLYASAQQISFDELIRRYSSQQGCTTIELSQTMLSSMGVSDGVEHMQVIAVEDKALLSELREAIPEITDGMVVIMSVNSGNESVKICCRNSKEHGIVELVVATFDDGEGVLVRICGTNINISDASSLIEEL